MRETPTPAETHRRDDGKGCDPDRSLIDLNFTRGSRWDVGEGVSASHAPYDCRRDAEDAHCCDR